MHASVQLLLDTLDMPVVNAWQSMLLYARLLTHDTGLCLALQLACISHCILNTVQLSRPTLCLQLTQHLRAG